MLIDIDKEIKTEKRTYKRDLLRECAVVLTIFLENPENRKNGKDGGKGGGRRDAAA